MKISIKHTALDKLKTDLLIIPAAPPSDRKPAKQKKNSKGLRGIKKIWSRFDAGVVAEIKELDRELAEILPAQVERLGYHPAVDKRLELFLGPDSDITHMRLSGLSSLRISEKRPLDEWRRLGGDAYQAAKRLHAKRVAISLGNARLFRGT